VIDDLGQVTLPLLGPIELASQTTSEAERKIERAYIDGGYYIRISVIVVAQEEEYFVRGEVRMPGRFPMRGDLRLTHAIAAAGGYTDFAKVTEIKIIRGEEVTVHNGKRIEQRREEDPMIRAGDVIVVPRHWSL
jgi:polysaccharide export outer membrane protein